MNVQNKEVESAVLHKEVSKNKEDTVAGFLKSYDGEL